MRRGVDGGAAMAACAARRTLLGSVPPHATAVQAVGATGTDEPNVAACASPMSELLSLSLSTNGTRITVGAKQNDAAGNDAGSVRVYEWKTDPTWSDYPTEKWVAVSLDILAEAAGDAAGFAVSMAGDGNRVAIGAPESDANGTDSGQVRVYELERWDAIAPWPPHPRFRWLCTGLHG